MHHTLSLLLLPSHTLVLPQRRVPVTEGSPPRTSPMWVLPTGCSPSGTDCSSVGPTQGHKVTSGACSSAGFLWGHSLLQASNCSSVRSSTVCMWISAPPWTYRGTACLTMLFSTGCSRISALAPGAPPLPPSPVTSVSAELFPSHRLIPLLLCRWFFFPS